MSPLWALGGGFVVALALGWLVLPVLRRLKLGQAVRDVGPKTHLQKAGTPTMGGVIFLIGTLVASLLFGPRETAVDTALGFSLANGAVGLADDWIKVHRRQSLGVRARTKLSLGIAFGLALGWLALGPLDLGTYVLIPFSHSVWHLPAWGFVLLVVVVGVGTTNAVNLSDGLDGLAGGLGMIAAALFAAIAVSEGVFGVATFCLALAGAVGGFLYYNLHPAKVIMGDVGSFGLGGALAAAAVILRAELILPIVGIVFVAETVSVVVQVAYFRRTGRRLLRMAPLHHHYELSGLSETQVTVRFWVVAVLAAIIGYIAFLT